MKIVLFAHLVVLLLYGCGIVSNTDEVKPFIPGIYVRHYTDEYTDSYDTIRITSATIHGSTGYWVIKRSRFQKIDNDGKSQPGYELKKWIATYDEKNHTLFLEKAGKSIYFDPANRELKIGTEPYKKL